MLIRAVSVTGLPWLQTLESSLLAIILMGNFIGSYLLMKDKVVYVP